MKQLFRTGTNRYVVEDIPAPAVGDREVLIEVRCSLISSGTETGSVRSNRKKGVIGKITGTYTNAERAINFLKEKGLTELLRKLESRKNISVSTGYSVAGVVVAKGRMIEDLEVGDSVAAAGSGIASHAEVVSIPRNLVARIPRNVDYRQAAFTTVGSIALQGVRQARTQVADTVVVIGLGLIGLVTVQILKASGCRVIGVDIQQAKVDKAIDIGLDVGLVSGVNTVVNDVIRLTDGLGADSVIITAAAKSSDIVNDSMQMVRKRGRVVVVGAVGMDISRSPFYEKEVEFTISCSYGPGRYDSSYEVDGIDYPAPYVRWTENRNMQAFLWMLERQSIDVDSLVSDRYTIDEAPSAFEKILAHPEATLAVQIEYPEGAAEKKTISKIKACTTPPRKKGGDQLNVAVLGAGGFASRTYLPFIYKSNKLNLKAVATKSGKNAKKLALDFKAEYCTTNYMDIVQDETVDAVIIASRHDLHYEMAMAAIKNGKHVLMEKPMGMTDQQIDSLSDAVENSDVIFAVGYNRRYSRLSQNVKKLINREIPPVLVNYRVNAGHIPPSHWSQSKKQGGGRVIGEACHFFDLINFFTPGKLVNVSAEKIPVNSKTVVANDNFVSTLMFDDGSMGVLTYTSLGHKGLPKEYIEIFINGKALIIDDFRSLKSFGFNNESISLDRQDKGQEQQLEEFAKAILAAERGVLIPLEDSALSAHVAIAVDKLIS